jgi:hypothetical protein
MNLIASGLLCSIALLVAATATLTAHHSAAPNYDVSRQVEIRGTIERFEGRNPHSFLYIRSGSTVHKCEFNAIANLVQAGIPATTFQVGQSITVTVNPHRRIRSECLIVSGRLSDGRVISNRVKAPPPPPLAVAPPAVAQPIK